GQPLVDVSGDDRIIEVEVLIGPGGLDVESLEVPATHIGFEWFVSPKDREECGPNRVLDLRPMPHHEVVELLPDPVWVLKSFEWWPKRIDGGVEVGQGYAEAGARRVQVSGLAGGDQVSCADREPFGAVVEPPFERFGIRECLDGVAQFDGEPQV